MYGKRWSKVAALVKTRTLTQIRTHAQKYYLKLSKQKHITEREVDKEESDHSQEPEEGHEQVVHEEDYDDYEEEEDEEEEDNEESNSTQSPIDLRSVDESDQSTTTIQHQDEVTYDSGSSKVRAYDI